MELQEFLKQSLNPQNLKHQAHGLSVAEMKEFKDKQNSEDIETIPANRRKGDYINTHEQHLLHAEIEDPAFDPKTGAKLSKAAIQKFYPKDFALMVKEGAFKGLKVEIVHEPEEKAITRPVKTEVENTMNITSEALGMDAFLKANEKAESDSGKKSPSTKSLDRMNEKEIREKYEEVFGEIAEETFSISQMRDAIIEKLAMKETK